MRLGALLTASRLPSGRKRDREARRARGTNVDAMPTLHYRVVDVFTDRPFAGNPLAVVLDADGEDDADLARIARQFNLSETAFPMLPTDEQRAAGADYRLRIFTPAGELPFAGHPSIGAAWVLASMGRIEAGTVRQACGAGVVSLRVDADGGPVELTGGALVIGETVDPGPVLECASLPQGTDLARAPVVAGAGLPFVVALLTDDRDVTRAAPDLAAMRSPALRAAAGGVDLVAWDPDARTAHCRVLTTSVGSGEDPGTGSAALALGAVLVDAGLLDGEGESRFSVRQGAEIGRPSRLEVTVRAEGGRPVECRVAGDIAPVAWGEIRRPTVRR
jgi:trans-2,3-dihydro-3-hydroxyanthranilate isomerase